MRGAQSVFCARSTPFDAAARTPFPEAPPPSRRRQESRPGGGWQSSAPASLGKAWTIGPRPSTSRPDRRDLPCSPCPCRTRRVESGRACTPAGHRPNHSRSVSGLGGCDFGMRQKTTPLAGGATPGLTLTSRPMYRSRQSRGVHKNGVQRQPHWRTHEDTIALRRSGFFRRLPRDHQLARTAAVRPGADHGGGRTFL